VPASVAVKRTPDARALVTVPSMVGGKVNGGVLVLGVAWLLAPIKIARRPRSGKRAVLGRAKSCDGVRLLGIAGILAAAKH
jgi:hypothetical protein